MSEKMYYFQAVEHFLQEEFGFEDVRVNGDMLYLQDKDLLGRITRIYTDKVPLFKEDVQKIEKVNQGEYQSMRVSGDEIMITFVHIFETEEIE